MTNIPSRNPGKVTRPDAWYNTKDGIEPSLKTLAGLNKLFEARGKAGYGRKETLAEFIVLGTWQLDSCGNAMKAIEMTPKMAYAQHGKLIIPSVVTPAEVWDTLTRFTGEHVSLSFGFKSDLPQAQLVCPCCGNPWTVHDCDDVVVRHETKVVPVGELSGLTLGEYKAMMDGRTDAAYLVQPDVPVRNDAHIDKSPDLDFPTLSKNERGWLREKNLLEKYRIPRTDDYVIRGGDEVMLNVWTYYHKACHRSEINSAERTSFAKIFSDAGVEVLKWSDTANEYCQCNKCRTWMLAKTKFGTFKIGWRKRVINIEFDGGINLKDLFADQDVTKGKDFIHAWGVEKATEYVGKIGTAAKDK